MRLVRGSIVVAFALALAVAAASCGGSSSSSGTSDATSAVADSTTSASTAATTDTGSSGGGDSGFCASAKAQTAGLAKELKPLSNIKSTPARLKATLATVDRAYAGMISSAPSEIKGDLEVMYSTFQKLEDVYSQNDYNAMQSLPKLVTSFNSAKFKTAVKHLEAWGKANCPGLN